MVFGLTDVTLLAFGIAAFGAFLCCAVSVGAGIGGGALYMPIYVFLTGDAHIAVPLSKVTTNGVAWSAFLFNLWLEHPERGGPLIDYDVVLILEPLCLVGTVIGVALNVHTTTAEILVALVLILVPTAWKTLQKGWEQKKKEEAGRGRAGSIELEAVESNQGAGLAQQAAQEAAAPLTEAQRAASQELNPQIPTGKLTSLVVNWGVHGALLVIAGGPTSIACGNTFQRSILGLLVLWHCVFTLVWRRRALDQHAAVAAATGVAGNYSLDSRTTLTYPLLSCFAGMCAGGLGIAAGLIMGPILLTWGLLPQASTATAIFTVLFTSSSTILQFIILGRLALGPSIVVWLIGFLGGLAGSKIVSLIMKRFGRQWMISVGLGYLIILSGLFMMSISVASLLGWIPNTGEDSRGCENDVIRAMMYME